MITIHISYLDIEREVPFIDPATDMAIRIGTIHAITGIVCSVNVYNKYNDYPVQARY